MNASVGGDFFVSPGDILAKTDGPHLFACCLPEAAQIL
jgi:hypothetical protein